MVKLGGSTAVKILPVMFIWNDDGVMEPDRRYKQLCDRQFVVGESYALTVDEHRSSASHRHYFASVHEAWMNLDHKYDGRFPSAEHLRAWALVEVGYCDEEVFAMPDKRDAMRLAKFLRRQGPLKILQVSGNVVRCWTARSQAVSAMKREEFQDSKKKVLDLLSSMIGTTRGALEKQGKKLEYTE